MYDSFIAALEDVANGTQGLSRLRGNSHGLVLRGLRVSNDPRLPDFIEGVSPVMVPQIGVNCAGEVGFLSAGCFV